MNDFFDTHKQMFYFSESKGEKLFAQSVEYMDNVIPASNSAMALNLFKLGIITGNTLYLQTADTMLKNVLGLMAKYGSSFSNWAILLMHKVLPYSELAIVGKNARSLQKEFYKQYIPNVLLCVSEKESKLPLLANRFTANQSLLYVCRNYACQQPVKSINEVLSIIQQFEK